MKRSTNCRVLSKRTVVVRFVFVATLAIALVSFHADAASPSPSEAKNDAALKQQIAELQSKVKQLERMLAGHAQQPGASPSMAGMTPAPAGGSMSMGMGDMNMGGMQNKPSSEQSDMMSMMGMMKEMKMGAMPAASSGMAAMPPSALPGFPGVSHLYHIGATGFFLDHAEHINLSSDQQIALNKVKDQAIAAKTDSDRQIESAEQQLADLTAADQPDAAKIDKKVHEIEKLRVQQRLAFIRAVGKAATLLTDDQRKILTGAMQSTTPAAAPSVTMSPMSDM